VEVYYIKPRVMVYLHFASMRASTKNINFYFSKDFLSKYFQTLGPGIKVRASNFIIPVLSIRTPEIYLSESLCLLVKGSTLSRYVKLKTLLFCLPPGERYLHAEK
jgi:hypothetical protein